MRALYYQRPKPKNQLISKQKELMKMRYKLLDQIHKKGSMDRREISEFTGWNHRKQTREMNFIYHQYPDEVVFNNHTKRTISLKQKKPPFEISVDWDSYDELMRSVKIDCTN